MVGRRREVLALHPFLLRPWWMKNLEGAGNLQLEKGTLFGLGAREDVIRGPGLSLDLGRDKWTSGVDRCAAPSRSPG